MVSRHVLLSLVVLWSAGWLSGSAEQAAAQQSDSFVETLPEIRPVVSRHYDEYSRSSSRVGYTTPCTQGNCAGRNTCVDGGACANEAGCGDDGKLFGLFAHSDQCFNDFISPMTNPVFFEDPRTLTELRFFFLHHNVPGKAGGGSIQVVAMQIRAALTERIVRAQA